MLWFVVRGLVIVVVVLRSLLSGFVVMSVCGLEQVVCVGGLLWSGFAVGGVAGVCGVLALSSRVISGSAPGGVFFAGVLVPGWWVEVLLFSFFSACILGAWDAVLPNVVAAILASGGGSVVLPFCVVGVAWVLVGAEVLWRAVVACGGALLLVLLGGGA
ncbi:hypothetical protein [Janthinobacterium sp. 344]|uniref:hypothetical protein n=1 Tax=Janthinobacterium sp. 344 TaxID=1566280 RepID=UPI001113E0EB|nr:hypothetical protein [Janthinobacterium sp. 344]